ncbi:MAG: putative minor head protein [Prokaryotic dsDNA virus sp.]|nr:MAG: putative minor head protein [Prokaryotic dsDNA virus sp.]|tara:strand:- start:15255 stop:16373 length:1119 start_codon:yes stop_codon:yes gene_type:complete
MSVNDDIADALTSHSIGLQRLSNREVRQIIAILKKSDSRLVERLLREDMSAISRARQQKLLKDIRAIVASSYEDATGALHINLNQLAEYEGEYQANMLQRIVPITVDWITPSPDQLFTAATSRPFEGRLLREWYQKIEADAQSRIRTTIQQGIVEQRTTMQMVREIRGTRAQGFKDGVLAINKRAAEAVVRTAVGHTATASRERLYKRNKRLVKGAQWLSTLDTRTSTPCRAADNRVAWADGYTRRDFPKATKFLADLPGFTNATRPPYHINCRSTTTPVLRSFKELGLPGKDLTDTTRASMDGQVAADLTYSDWFRKQSAAKQDEVLGPSKAKLFRAGEIDLDRFINDKGQELTLDQLRTQEAAAWERAGL